MKVVTIDLEEKLLDHVLPAVVGGAPVKWEVEDGVAIVVTEEKET